MLKFRASYGVAGNNAIGRYKYESFLSSRNYVFGDEVANGLAVANIANPDLGWERKTSANVGVELGLFSNRIYVTVDAYRDVTSDMLLNANIPATLGQSTMTLNIGSVENKGIELGVSTSNISRRYFQWTTRFNILFNRNRVLSLSGDADMIFDGESGTSNVTMEGWPVGVFYGRVYKGVYMSWDEIRQLAADPNNGLAFDPKTVPGADRNKFSTYQLEDASYLCIKNVSLGYTFPASLLKRSFIKGLSVSLNIDNLHTFTRYSGQNIEANNYRRATALGIDYTSYPLARTYTMSVNLKF